MHTLENVIRACFIVLPTRANANTLRSTEVNLGPEYWDKNYPVTHSAMDTSTVQVLCRHPHRTRTLDETLDNTHLHSWNVLYGAR